MEVSIKQFGDHFKIQLKLKISSKSIIKFAKNNTDLFKVLRPWPPLVLQPQTFTFGPIDAESYTPDTAKHVPLLTWYRFSMYNAVSRFQALSCIF